MQPTVRKGFYRHYKGPVYEVLDLVRHSETEEWLVLYRTCYGDWGRWVRPHAMFTGMVTGPDGEEMPRFAWIGEDMPG
ncbi:DUF1653 domain-containing protein [Perlucidibaca piscinae]|uniref:DUF1653 domain-containing protein n=1 Tax=Perlucidibaca piscinae TaxID=392589 RepID=UPI0003B364AD|nr:DUF1653 domain-containing protein [Perlucidibaca piscinae]